VRLFRRARNLVRKLRAGLTPFGENVSPEVPNDLFIAHLSIYAFAAPHARGGRVLDIGSGAGYGSEFLRNAGATEVIGLDLDPRNVRYANRHYPNIEFRDNGPTCCNDGSGASPHIATFHVPACSRISAIPFRRDSRRLTSSSKKCSPTG
jgi:2-polyprenyl-3-methyl-5-hydroxy-6-metoxy-1,4-benzoquinol methylase